MPRSQERFVLARRLLYVLLTGRLPFGYARDIAPEAVAKRVTSGAYDPPEAIVPSIPKRLAELVESLLQVDPDLRPQSAAEIADRLEARGNVDRELGQFVRDATSGTCERTSELPPSEAETREGPKPENVQLSDDVTRLDGRPADDARIADAPLRTHDDAGVSGPLRAPRAKRLLVATAALALSIAIGWIGYGALTSRSAAEPAGTSPEVAEQLDEGTTGKPTTPHAPVVVTPQPAAAPETGQQASLAPAPLVNVGHNASAAEPSPKAESRLRRLRQQQRAGSACSSRRPAILESTVASPAPID